MKKIFWMTMLLLLFALFALSAVATASAATKMSITSSGINDGTIGDQYGKRGTQKSGKVPTLSLPIEIADAPDGTICFAVQMIDPDSSPKWVHWLAANIETADLPENASISLAKSIVQGRNSFKTSGYGGPTPPDRPHTYVITVYALDAKINLKANFSQSQFDNAIKGHVLAEASMKGRYSN